MVENILPSATLSINTLRDVNHLMERLIEEWRDLDHNNDNIICVAVNQWRTRQWACVCADGGHFEQQQYNRYSTFELLPTVFVVLETCNAFSVLVLKYKNITTQVTQFIQIVYTVPRW